jgi:hypothetical protein
VTYNTLGQIFGGLKAHLIQGIISSMERPADFDETFWNSIPEEEREVFLRFRREQEEHKRRLARPSKAALNFQLHISQEARDKLNMTRAAGIRKAPRTGIRVIPRAKLHTLFHSQYIDARKPFEVASEVWSPDDVFPRTSPTSVHITKAQVAAVMRLAVEHEIVPPKDLSETRLINYLLGTFLEAVIMGRLREKEITAYGPPRDAERFQQMESKRRAASTRAKRSRTGIPSSWDV